MLPGPMAPGPPPPEYSFPSRQFIKNTLYEAFDERRQEDWPMRNLNLPSDRPLTSEEVARILNGRVGVIVREVLGDAYAEADYNWPGRRIAEHYGTRILLIDLLVSINRGWCNVWPFCRPSRSSRTPGLFDV